MTTYNTYQEAKIANPESDIFTKAGKFIGECDLRPSPYTYEYRGIAKCNPADHCVTVEKFLADGHEFQVGDIICGSGSPKEVTDSTVNIVSSPGCGDKLTYILRAAALEEKKPRTKAGYVKCEFNSRGAALDFFDNNEELYEPSCNPEGYSLCEDPCNVIDMWDQLYRRIETPMTERDELFEALQSVWIIDGVDGQEQLEKIVNSGLVKLVS